MLNKILSTIAIVTCIESAPSMSLKDIWQDGKINEGYIPTLCAVYEERYEQWKSDTQYLMSQEFTTQYLKEIHEGTTMCHLLFKVWRECGCATREYDLYWNPNCKWTEQNRDEAFCFMGNAITIYKNTLNNLTNIKVKASIMERIEDLKYVQMEPVFDLFSSFILKGHNILMKLS